MSRGLLWWLAALFIAPALLILVRSDDAWHEIEWGLLFGLVAVIAVPFFAFAVSPWGWELKHVAVTDEGLWFRHHLLPVPRIGRVAVLGQWESAGMYSLLRRRHGLRRHPRRSSANPLWMRNDDVPVLVEDIGAGRAWLVATRDPDGLVAALQAMRTQPLPQPEESAGSSQGWSRGVRVISRRQSPQRVAKDADDETGAGDCWRFFGHR